MNCDWDNYEHDAPTYEDLMQLEQRLDNAEEWMREVVDYLYGKRPFNERNFENALDELAHCLRVRLPRQELKVQAKGEAVLVDWINFNTNYLKSL